MSQGRRLALLLAAILVVRVLIHPYGTFHADFLSWVSWGRELWQGDWATFYDRAWNDRLPAVFYLLSVLAGLQELWPALPTTLLYKLPANLADIGIAWTLYRLLAPIGGGRSAVVASVAYALNPFTWHVSALWGQLDAIQALLLVGTVAFLHRNRPHLATGLLTVATLIKPHSLALAPLIAVSIWKSGRSLPRAVRTGVLAIGIATVTAWGITAPFVPRAQWSSPLAAPFSFLAERTRIASDQYQFASVNAFNLWTALGGNWQPDAQRSLGVRWQHWGILLFSAGVFIALWPLLRRQAPLDLSALALCAAVLSLLAFTVLTRAHERHIYPFFALFALAGLTGTRDRVLYAVLTLAALANTVYAYATLELKQPDPLGRPLITMLSLLPVVACGALLFAPTGRRPATPAQS